MSPLAEESASLIALSKFKAYLAYCLLLSRLLASLSVALLCSNVMLIPAVVSVSLVTSVCRTLN